MGSALSPVPDPRDPVPRVFRIGFAFLMFYHFFDLLLVAAICPKSVAACELSP